MPIIYVNPAGHGRAHPKKRSAKMAKKRKKSASRDRYGHFKKKSKGTKHRRKAAPAVKARAKARRKTASRKTSKRRHPPSTMALRKFAAVKGYKVVRRKKRKGSKKRRRRTHVTGAPRSMPKTRRVKRRVAKHVAAAYRHKTYPVANPARRRKRRKMRHNPRHNARRAHRRYRRNPSIGGLMAFAKKAVPVLAAMLGGKLVVKQIASKVPGIDKLGSFQDTALSIGMLLLGNVITDKVGSLKKHQDSIMIGLGLNVFTSVLGMTPLKGMLGLGEGIYDRALSDYITTADYITTGAAPPIDDNIALSDYITTGGLEEELGLSEELGMGLSEELGAIDAGTVPGGVSQLAMIKSIPHQSFMENVPARSFTEQVPRAGQGYDNPGALYAGIFRGGF